jgi:hypothetical protein
VHKLTTVDKLAMDTAGNAVDPNRCRPAVLGQHAHTPAQHAVYTALWNLAGPPDSPDPYRDVTIGYDKLAALVGGSKRNMQRLAEILQRKLALEVLREENSGLRQGKTYRVYGMAEILRRRNEAGYVWIFRNRSAVALVKMTPVDKIATQANLPPDPLDKLPSALGSSLGNENAKAAPSPRSKIVELMADEETAAKLIARCRRVNAAATEEEVLHFLQLRVAFLRRHRPLPDNCVEFLLTTVPHYFQQPLVLERFRAEQSGGAPRLT